jgi:acyl carrier protein
MNYTKEVRDFVVSNFLFGDPALLQDNTSFLDGGIVDSTGILELIMFLEQKFGIKVQPDEMIPDNLDSVEKVTRFLTRKTATQPTDE